SLFRSNGFQPRWRTSPSIGSRPASIEPLIRGHSISSVLLPSPCGVDNAASQNLTGPRSQSSDRICRRTIALKSGEPLAGAEMSDGTVRPSSNHSRTNQLIPPHSPASASPTPTHRGSSIPSFTVGPEAYLLAKWRPLTDGRNPS